jgi:hypothetical protein
MGLDEVTVESGSGSAAAAQPAPSSHMLLQPPVAAASRRPEAEEVTEKVKLTASDDGFREVERVCPDAGAAQQAGGYQVLVEEVRYPSRRAVSATCRRRLRALASSKSRVTSARRSRRAPAAPPFSTS